MKRFRLIATIGTLSLGAVACGDYDEKNAAYDGNNASYEAEGNAGYDQEGNAAYDSNTGNAASAPPADTNMSTDNVVDPVPPPAPTTNGY